MVIGTSGKKKLQVEYEKAEDRKSLKTEMLCE